MPNKKSTKEASKAKTNREVEETEQDFLEEDDEEEKVEDEEEYFLDSKAEQKIDEALAILHTGHGGIIEEPVTQQDNPISKEFPTENHLKNRVKYTPGDVAPEHNETLILRKP